MPIKPENRALYPPDWPEISARIRARSAGQCECTGECGLHQAKEVPCSTCIVDGVSFDCRNCGGTGKIVTGPRRCKELHGATARWANGRIQLTVAHLNHDPTDNRPENLKAMCQRCHLRVDAPQHQANAAATRRAKLQNLELPF